MTVPVAEKAAQVSTSKVAAKKAVAKPSSDVSEGSAKKPATKSTRNNNKTIKRQAGNAKSRYMPTLRPAKSVVRYRQILAAEFVIATVMVFTGPAGDETATITDELVGKTFAKTVEQEAMLVLVFFILSTFTVAGPSAARVSAALGGVILLTLLLKQQNPVTRFIPAKVTPGGQAEGGSTAENNILYGG